MKKFRFILFLLALAVVVTSCGRRGRIIPRAKLAEIYAEMFILDQQINHDRTSKKIADTSLVYGAVFEKYGYTVDDYRATMARYIEDPNRYARILKKSALIIETEIKGLKEEKKRLEELEKMLDKSALYKPERIFYLTGLGNPDLFVEDSLSFFVDSTGGMLYFDVREWLDTAFFGPEMIVRE